MIADYATPTRSRGALETRGRALLSGWRQVLDETLTAWSHHGAMTHAAALAFYTLASLAPILVVVVAVAGTVFGADAVRGQVVTVLTGYMGPAEAQVVQDILKTAAFSSAGGLAGAIALVALLSAATGFFLQLQEALNQVWEVPAATGRRVRRFIKKRVASFALLLGIGFLLLTFLALNALLAGFEHLLVLRFPVAFRLVEVLNTVVSFAVAAVLFGLIYRILPDVKIAWREVALAAVFTASLFSVGKWLIGLYLGRAAVASPYGAAGSLVVLLFWVYFSSLIFLFGAELTRVTARRLEASPA